MTTRFINHLLEGDHASRPAFGDVPEGTLYACSTHGLIYQSDGVAAWSTWWTGTGVADILNLPTAEMDDTLVLAPDGAGGVEFRAEAGGGGGGAPLGITRYAPGSDALHASTTSATQGDVDATNALVTFTAPASGNVIVTLAMMVLVGSNVNAYFGLRESTTNVAGPHMVTNAPTANLLSVLSRDFYLTGISAGSHTYKAAWSVAGGGTLSLYAGPAYGPVEMTVWAA